MTLNDYFHLLGFKVRDVVTGLEGVCESISFDLYGCVQAIVRPGLNEKGEPGTGHWFDLKRLVAISDTRVMAVPSFDVVPGGTDKPAAPSQPVKS